MLFYIKIISITITGIAGIIAALTDLTTIKNGKNKLTLYGWFFVFIFLASIICNSILEKVASDLQNTEYRSLTNTLNDSLEKTINIHDFVSRIDNIDIFIKFRSKINTKNKCFKDDISFLIERDFSDFFIQLYNEALSTNENFQTINFSPDRKTIQKVVKKFDEFGWSVFYKDDFIRLKPRINKEPFIPKIAKKRILKLIHCKLFIIRKDISEDVLYEKIDKFDIKGIGGRVALDPIINFWSNNEIPKITVKRNPLVYYLSGEYVTEFAFPKYFNFNNNICEFEVRSIHHDQSMVLIDPPVGIEDLRYSDIYLVLLNDNDSLTPVSIVLGPHGFKYFNYDLEFVKRFKDECRPKDIYRLLRKN